MKPFPQCVWYTCYCVFVWTRTTFDNWVNDKSFTDPAQEPGSILVPKHHTTQNLSTAVDDM